MADSTSPWVDGLTIGQVLAGTVARYGDRDALVFPGLGLRWTWRQFQQEVDRVACGLAGIGLGKGDHVAVWATNKPEWVLLQFATARIGAVLVTVNPAYRPFELRFVLKQSDAKALFLVDRFKTSDYFAMLAEICPDLAHAERGMLQSDEYPHLKAVVAINGEPPAGVLGWSDLLDAGSALPLEMLDSVGRTLDPLEPINIQYTSGTTGFPKAAMLSHRNILLNAYYIGQRQRITAEDRICIPVPFYHCFGCVLGTLCSVVHGAAMILPAEYFQPEATLDAIEQGKATVLYGVPTMFIAQLQHPTFAGRDLSSLRTGIMSGSPCPIEVMRQVIDKMGAKDITIAYGQTEASPVVTQTDVDDPIQLRVETVGKPLPGIEVKLVDPETQQVCGDNQQGEICSRGHVVMLGYYGDPAATAAAIDSDGFLHSGDLAIRLPNGYYRITGRMKDMVIRGGENIYPREIEEFLFTHDAIEQAVVLGVPDEKYGEELCAWIKLKQGAQLDEADVREFCRCSLAHYKAPRYIRFVAEFPQTVTGKIQKFKIRETMIKDHGLAEQETA
ncbi:AMP-binding protein [Lignipirellula cremea]|uniref:Long-chain-fatty-acid--CoA ligase n=1 Tax=Lignipirellula cremea TaxID=2528010 RepID=A0A518DVX3_9BACT|nr:AMP-binding protein [Lignipirellula cremea]QDU95990.1 Long-chain-fatty-acid--CoA ligase [Lignipirellula cremea]